MAFRSLRASAYARHAIRRGCWDPIALAALLGHAYLKMVMQYCHTRESHTAAAMKKYIGSFEKETAVAVTTGKVN